MTGAAGFDAGRRVELDEPAWDAVARATGLVLDDAPLKPLPGAPAHLDGGPPEEPAPELVEAAALALGRALMGVTVVAGAGERGVLAQVGADTRALGSVVRAVVTGVPGVDGPTAVPGVQLGVRPAGHMVEEIMRLVPSGGVERDLPRGSVALDRDDALIVARTVGTDDEIARHTVRRAGFDTVPEVLEAVARPTTASATLTISTGAAPLHGVRQWLLTDRGWVSITMLGRRVVHTPRSRTELAVELTSVLAGAWDAALAARARAS